MFSVLSVVIIITTLKKPAGHFVTSVTPQLVGSWGFAVKHDMLSYGYTGWLSPGVNSGLEVTLYVFRHSLIGERGSIMRRVGRSYRWNFGGN
jgi:hypothetical protein